MYSASTYVCVYKRVGQYKCKQHLCEHTPLVSLADCLIRVGCELLVLLVDAVVGEVGKPVGEGLGGGGVPGASKRKRRQEKQAPVVSELALYKPCKCVA